eukprot:CAMPEP_0115430456 /NCGR_PEP_ID=MMETSP0271-20121206/31056_1 /TAXON_ID=71861 /ORGANISM="Scrippsiella trochoidea, Strain CCMP3099" /LENGTH=188 /DNA_ID=CAMNT_0002855689 /DNA_START=316 /DNA_END=880 /DNA_ORIENTATION=-
MTEPAICGPKRICEWRPIQRWPRQNQKTTAHRASHTDTPRTLDKGASCLPSELHIVTPRLQSSAFSFFPLKGTGGGSQAQQVQDLDCVPREVNLPPLQPVSARVLEGVVVVVPTFPECKHTDDPIVHRVVLGVPILEAPDVTDGVHRPCDVPHPDNTCEETPHHEGEPSKGVQCGDRNDYGVERVGLL